MPRSGFFTIKSPSLFRQDDEALLMLRATPRILFPLFIIYLSDLRWSRVRDRGTMMNHEQPRIFGIRNVYEKRIEILRSWMNRLREQSLNRLNNKSGSVETNFCLFFLIDTKQANRSREGLSFRISCTISIQFTPIARAKRYSYFFFLNLYEYGPATE